MYTLLIVILVLVSVALVAAFLWQAGKGGGLAASFGGASSSSDSILGTRQAGNFLTRASWWCGGIFLGLSLILSLLTLRSRVPESVLDRPLAPAPATPSTSTPAPAVPLEPGPQNSADSPR